MDEQKQLDLFKQAKQWVLEAGKIIRDRINDPIQVDTKSNVNDLVTTMDKETEEYFARKIKETYPDHLLFGEEGYGDQITTLDGTIWIVDPIDGTMNFVHQKRNFAISVGIYENGIGEIGFIYDVMSDVLYYANKGKGAFKNGERLPKLTNTPAFKEVILGLNHFWLCKNRLVDERVMQELVQTIRGSRTIGSAALEMAYVAEGIIDGYLAMRLSPWDVAAGQIIIHETGGVVSDRDGLPVNMLEKNSIVACNQQIHSIIINEYLKKAKK